MLRLIVCAKRSSDTHAHIQITYTQTKDQTTVSTVLMQTPWKCIHQQTQVYTVPQSFINACKRHYEYLFTLSPLPPNSECMTFERNRNADWEDCFNLIYCQKAKPWWKPAKMSAVAGQGSVALLCLQRQTWMFGFVLPFFYICFPDKTSSLYLAFM